TSDCTEPSVDVYLVLILQCPSCIRWIYLSAYRQLRRLFVEVASGGARRGRSGAGREGAGGAPGSAPGGIPGPPPAPGCGAGQRAVRTALPELPRPRPGGGGHRPRPCRGLRPPGGRGGGLCLLTGPRRPRRGVGRKDPRLLPG